MEKSEGAYGKGSGYRLNERRGCDELSKRKKQRKSAKDHNDAMRWQKFFISFYFISC